ncbi:MAG: hypothetical protein ACOX64_10115 [Candidatus Merdivicinus sp.]
MKKAKTADETGAFETPGIRTPPFGQHERGLFISFAVFPGFPAAHSKSIAKTYGALRMENSYRKAKEHVFGFCASYRLFFSSVDIFLKNRYNGTIESKIVSKPERGTA